MQTSISVLLNAANYILSETIIDGSKAAQIESMVNTIANLMASIPETENRLASAKESGKEVAIRISTRKLEKETKQLDETVNALREWLIEFKKSRPNVKINLDIEAVKSSYIDYIIECAEYQAKTA